MRRRYSAWWRTLNEDVAGWLLPRPTVSHNNSLFPILLLLLNEDIPICTPWCHVSEVSLSRLWRFVLFTVTGVGLEDWIPLVDVVYEQPCLAENGSIFQEGLELYQHAGNPKMAEEDKKTKHKFEKDTKCEIIMYSLSSLRDMFQRRVGGEKKNSAYMELLKLLTWPGVSPGVG